MATLPTTYSGKQAQVQTVSASAKPSEVVAAVIAGAQGARAASNPNRGIHFAFVFILIFAVTIYFREELWSISRDVSKHPIMGYVEQLQISHYLGAKWAFGSGKDVTPEELEVAKQQQAGSNPVAVPSNTSSSSSSQTATAAAAAPTGTQAQQQQQAGAGGATPGGADASKTPSSQAGSSGTTGAAAAATGSTGAAAARRSWARRLLTINHSKCDNTNAKMLMRRLLVLAQRQRHLLG